MFIRGTTKKPHPQKKNPEARRRHDAERKERNADRPKQRWLGKDEKGNNLGWARP